MSGAMGGKGGAGGIGDLTPLGAGLKESFRDRLAMAANGQGTGSGGGEGQAGDGGNAGGDKGAGGKKETFGLGLVLSGEVEAHVRDVVADIMR